MYHALLFLHLISAFLLAVTVVMYSAVALGAVTNPRTLFIADRCWDVGGLGTIVLGVWLVLNVDQYDITDGWIIGAIVLWFIATGLGQSVQRRLGSEETSASAVTTMHWLRALVVIGLLALMVWKPGA